ncbi:MAG: hypothetical protein Ct9H300mP12_15140 [Acidimicrobiales bacterium]|nr:MAG: hypothetical protein Ct9H300mP12_15140 [Acidimicrobiales bacterium]
MATIGRAAATDLLLTARRFGADEALRIGLVHDVVAADQLDDLTADRCATIASLAPMTLRAARAALAGQPDAAAPRRRLLSQRRPRGRHHRLRGVALSPLQRQMTGRTTPGEGRPRNGRLAQGCWRSGYSGRPGWPSTPTSAPGG